MSNLKIGWASRDISTTAPVMLWGQFYVRVSEGISDPTKCTALALSSGEDTAIFLSIDIVEFAGIVFDEICSAVKEKNSAIPIENIIIGATHTHTAPYLYGYGLDYDNTVPSDMPKDGAEIEDPEVYRKFLVASAADAICEAYENRQEGGIAYGYGYAVTGHSRRVVYFDDISKRGGSDDSLIADGKAKMYGETNDDMFSHFEAGADHFTNFLFTFDSKNKLTGAIINLPCPSQCSEHEHRISADFWHEIREEIKAKYGDIFVLSQCAAAGDSSPRILHNKKAQERRFKLKYGDMEHTRAERADIAERVAQSFDEVLSWAQKDIKTDVEIACRTETLELAKRLIPKDEYESAKEGLRELETETYKTDGGTNEKLIEHNSLLDARRHRFKEIIDRFEAQKAEPTVPTEIRAVKVGDIAFASNVFELYTDYMHRIQARSPFEQTFIVQLAGASGKSHSSYLATERGVESKGYSASIFDNEVSPEGGQELVDETVRMLKEMYNQLLTPN